MVQFSLCSKLVQVISTLYGRGKLLEHVNFIFIWVQINRRMSEGSIGDCDSTI